MPARVKRVIWNLCRRGSRCGSEFLSHTTKQLFATKKSSKTEVFEDFWSCWADLNRRPHPYQAALELSSNHFPYLWPYPLQFTCFPSLFKKKVSACSVAVCGWLCGQSAEGEDFRDFDRLHKYGQITVFLTCRSTFAVVLTKNLRENFFFILIAECFTNTNQLPSQKLMR